MGVFLSKLAGSAFIPLILVIKAITSQNQRKNFSKYLIISAAICVLATVVGIVADSMNGGITKDTIITSTVSIAITAIGFIVCYTRKIK